MALAFFTHTHTHTHTDIHTRSGRIRWFSSATVSRVMKKSSFTSGRSSGKMITSMMALVEPEGGGA